MKISISKYIVTFTVLLAFGLSYQTTQLHGQAGFNTTRGLGMGGAGSTTVSGFHSNFVNPANLAASSRTKWSLGLIGGLNPEVSGGLANIALYNQYFTTGTTITPELNLDIAEQWFGSGDAAYKQLGFNVDIVPFGLSYRSGKMGFALTARSRVLGDVGMSKGAFLASTGLNSTVFGDFRAFDVRNEVLAIAEVSLGFGMNVWESAPGTAPGTMRVLAGIAPKYVIPLHYHAVNLESRLRVQENPYLITHDFAYEILAAGKFGADLQRFADDRQRNNKVPDVDGYFDTSFDDAGELRGSGIGFDFGTTFEYYLSEFPVQLWAFRGTHRLRASFTVTDFGSVNVNQNAVRVFNNKVFSWNGLDINQERIDNEFDKSFDDYFDFVVTDSIGRDIYMDFRAESLAEHKIDLPGTYNFGVSYDLGRLTFAMDFGAGFNNRATNSTKTYLALGSEIRLLNALPIRVGMRTGGNSSTAYSFGTGLNLRNFELTVAAMTVPDSQKNGTSQTVAFSGLIFRF